jgi:hypothetical protein
MVKSILPLILWSLLLTITVKVCKFYRNRKVVFQVNSASLTFLWHSSEKSAYQWRRNKAGKLCILTNVKCCSCLFYKFSPLSDNNNKMDNYNSTIRYDLFTPMHWKLICIEFLYDMTDNLQRLLYFAFFFITLYQIYSMPLEILSGHWEFGWKVQGSYLNNNKLWGCPF